MLIRRCSVYLIGLLYPCSYSHMTLTHPPDRQRCPLVFCQLFPVVPFYALFYLITCLFVVPLWFPDCLSLLSIPAVCCQQFLLSDECSVHCVYPQCNHHKSVHYMLTFSLCSSHRTVSGSTTIWDFLIFLGCDMVSLLFCLINDVLNFSLINYCRSRRASLHTIMYMCFCMGKKIEFVVK